MPPYVMRYTASAASSETSSEPSGSTRRPAGRPQKDWEGFPSSCSQPSANTACSVGRPSGSTCRIRVWQKGRAPAGTQGQTSHCRGGRRRRTAGQHKGALRQTACTGGPSGLGTVCPAGGTANQQQAENRQLSSHCMHLTRVTAPSCSPPLAPLPPPARARRGSQWRSGGSSCRAPPQAPCRRSGNGVGKRWSAGRLCCRR